ncbi:MAG: hypothetical protein QXO51_05930 [Halobacteria archaeon]
MGASSISLAFASLLLLAWGILHIAGGLYNLVLLAPGPSLLESLGVPSSEAAGAPRLARVASGVSAVWSGCIIGLGVEAAFLACGSFRRGERWAWMLTAATLGPADAGASALGLIAAPPWPYPAVLPLGVALFLGSLFFSAPAVWRRRG